MTGRYLLDTNVVIALFAAEAVVSDRIGAAEDIFVSAIVLGELYYGARKSSRVSENITRLDDFAVTSAILGCSHETAQRYGELKNSLRQSGHPIPENDIWIAAIAIEHGLTLVTRDDHFQVVAGLRTEAW